MLMIRKPIVILISVFLLILMVVVISGCDDNIDTTPSNTKHPMQTPSSSADESPNTEEPDESIGHQEPGDSHDPTKEPSPSKTPAAKPTYYIKVNVGAQIVTVYKMDSNGQYTIPYKNFITSTGLPGSETPLGKYEIYSSRHTWMRMVDNTYGQYAVRFNGPILFHSITYEKKSYDSFKWYEYNKLGYPASLGCVRLTVRDAKWIYDNCENGTVVEIYEGEPNLELWEKLRYQLKIPLPEGTNWDPTDPHPNNPNRLEDLPYPSVEPSPDPSMEETLLPTDDHTGETYTPEPTDVTGSPAETETGEGTETPEVTETPAETATYTDTTAPADTSDPA